MDGAVKDLVWPGLMLPVLNTPELDVSVCVVESLLVTSMCAPGVTLIDIGLNMKFLILMWYTFDEADATTVALGAVVSATLAKSRVIPTKGTLTPLLTKRRI